MKLYLPKVSNDNFTKVSSTKHLRYMVSIPNCVELLHSIFVYLRIQVQSLEKWPHTHKHCVSATYEVMCKCYHNLCRVFWFS